MPTARFIDGQDAVVESSDRGFAYGDGLFETIALRAGEARYLSYHLDRLQLGAERLQIPLPERLEIERAILEKANGHDRGTVKLIVTRGSGPRGYAPPAKPTPLLILSVEPVNVDGQGNPVDAVSLTMRIGENPKLAGIKHLCRLEQVLAQLELQHYDAQEGLLCSSSGRIIGGISSNVFGVFGKRLRTPRIVDAGVSGVMRRVVLESCGQLGLEPEEADLDLDELKAADELFLTNALIGIRPLGRLDGTLFPRHDAAVGLRALLEIDGHA